MDKCYLCKSNKRDEVKYGEFMTRGDISVHYFCLLLTSNLMQRGRDDQGFLGFLAADIKKEANRVAPAVCCYCKKKGANISCCAQKCRKTFHLICGLENDTLSEFVDTFKSYCNLHTPGKKSRGPKPDETCCICYEDILEGGSKINHVRIIQAPCCKNGWFHKWCLATFAKSSGYFFRCPLCNDSKVFRKRLVYKGIFIPDRDASWELEPNAFAELLERPQECCAVVCTSKGGRTGNANCNKLIFCGACGSIAIHRKCMTVATSDFFCDECSSIISAVNNASIVNISASQQENVDEDEDVDICGDDDMPVVGISVQRRPENNENEDTVRPLGRLKKSEFRIFDEEEMSNDSSDNEDDILRRNFRKLVPKRNRLSSLDDSSPICPVITKRKRVSSHDSGSFFDSGAESGRSESSGDKFSSDNLTKISSTTYFSQENKSNSNACTPVSSRSNKNTSSEPQILSNSNKSVPTRDKDEKVSTHRVTEEKDFTQKIITRRTSLITSPSNSWCIAKRTRSRSVSSTTTFDDNVRITRSVSRERGQSVEAALRGYCRTRSGRSVTPLATPAPTPTRSRRSSSLESKLGNQSRRQRTSSEDPSKTTPALRRTEKRSSIQRSFENPTRLEKSKSSETLANSRSNYKPINSEHKKAKSRSSTYENENHCNNFEVPRTKRPTRDRSPLSSNICGLSAFLTPNYVKKKEQQKGDLFDYKISIMGTELVPSEDGNPFSKNMPNIIRHPNKDSNKTEINTANKDVSTSSIDPKNPLNTAQETFLQSYSMLIGTSGKSSLSKPRRKRNSANFSKQPLSSNQTKIESFFKRI